MNGKREDRSPGVEALWTLLGGRPEAAPLEAEWAGAVQGETELGGRVVAWTRHELSYRAEPRGRVPAWLFTRTVADPLTDAGAVPRPAILYLHSHSGDYSRGRSESLLGKQRVPPGLAPRLVGAGFNVLAADFRCFGDRAEEVEGESARRHLLQGTTLWGRMLWDQVRALDLLEQLPGVDAERIGCLGFSMGSTAGWWLAALDRRIAAGAGLCCLSTYRAMTAGGVLHRHGLYFFVPRAAEIGVPGILALIAPRPFLFLNGDQDEASPVDGARSAVWEAREAGRRSGTGDRLALEVFKGCGHEMTPEMIERSVGWLADELGSGR